MGVSPLATILSKFPRMLRLDHLDFPNVRTLNPEKVLDIVASQCFDLRHHDLPSGQKTARVRWRLSLLGD